MRKSNDEDLNKLAGVPILSDEKSKLAFRVSVILER